MEDFINFLDDMSKRGCEICGRGNCSKNFHSIKEQNKFDEISNRIKNRTKAYVINSLNKQKKENINKIKYIKLDDIIDIINHEYF